MSEAAKAEIVQQGEKGMQNLPNPYDEPQAITPMELLQMAVSKGADIDKLEKLMDLQLRWQKEQAKQAYHAAMNAFKADPPEIIKNHTVSFGNTTYDHATLDNVCKAITGGLSKHNISHRWRIEQAEGFVRVTCVLTHSQGHSEETALSAGPDTSGSKNAIQAIGSAVTYLERYTLLAATGLAAKNGDNDGQGERPGLENLQEFLDSIATAPNPDILKETFNAGFKAAVSVQDTKGMKKLVEAKDARKLELAKETAA